MKKNLKKHQNRMKMSKENKTYFNKDKNLIK